MVVSAPAFSSEELNYFLLLGDIKSDDKGGKGTKEALKVNHDATSSLFVPSKWSSQRMKETVIL
jgi:hypothetical protein